MQNRNTFLVILVALSLITLTMDTKNCHADGVVKVIDRRNRSEENQYYIVLCARDGGVASHAFVVWGTDDAEKRICSSAAFGLYPRENASRVRILTLGTVPGEIANEALRGKGSSSTVRLIVKVNSDQYAATQKIRAKWAARGKYKLLTRDCVTFTSTVAKSLGLRLPSRAGNVLPQGFIRSLVQLNN